MKYIIIKKTKSFHVENGRPVFDEGSKYYPEQIIEGDEGAIKVFDKFIPHRISVIKIHDENRREKHYIRREFADIVHSTEKRKCGHKNPDGSITWYGCDTGSINFSGAEGSVSKIFNEEAFVVGIGGGLIGTGIGVILGVNTKTVAVLAAAGVVLGGVIAMGGGSEQKMGMAGRVPFKPTQPLYPSSGATSKPRKECAHYNTENVCDRWRDV